MKSFIAMMVLLSVSFSYTQAWDEYYETKEAPKEMEEREVIYYDHELEVELDDGIIEADWDKFELRGFDWYKLVYSTTNSNPVYPDDRVVFVGNINQRETSFKPDPKASKHYIRLCAVVLNDDYSKDRYCWKTQVITAQYEAIREKEDNYVCTMEYAPVCGKKDGKYQIYSNNCMREAADAYKVDTGYCETQSIQKSELAKEEYKREIEEKNAVRKQELEKKMAERKEQIKSQALEKKAILSVNMKARIDTVIGNFVEKLEDRWYTDAQMTSAINTVISRLWEFKNKAGYQEIVKYMVSVLEEHREEYSNPLEELESIFDGL